MKKLISFIALISQVCFLYAQEKYPDDIEAQIKQVENNLAGRVKIKGHETYNLTERMAFHHIKGLSMAVVKDYEVIWARGYGWADEKAKKPVTSETLFEPGSISKSLNAVGILKLVQDRKLDLHTDINTYLTSWKFPYDDVAKGKKITLAHLLSHSAGLTVHGFPGYDLMDAIPTVPQILDGEAPANTPAVRSAFEPGLKFQYSGGGTTISQLIVTDVTGLPYEAFMYENVLKPMGMLNSFYSQPPPEHIRHLCATGYHADGSVVPNRFHVYPEQAAAGLWMTPSDLCQFIIETQLAYQGRSSKVLTKEMTTLSLTPYNDASAALGVFVDNRNGTLYFQHSAGNEGFCGQFYGSLEGGNGVALFLNTNNFAIIPEVLNSVASVYDWKGFYEPIYKDAVTISPKVLKQYEGIYKVEADHFTSIVKKKDGYYLYADGMYSKMYFSNETDFFNIEFSSEKHFFKDAAGDVSGYLRTLDGTELPSAMKVKNPDTLRGSPDFFNAVGWNLIENKKFGEAIQYLERGLKLHPESLWIEGNLAHAYLFNGHSKRALEIYRSHIGQSITADITWVDMINMDFVSFSNSGLSPGPMNRV